MYLEQQHPFEPERYKKQLKLQGVKMSIALQLI
jgi:hypothetical protein